MTVNAKKIGIIGEIAFCLKAEKFGLDVSTPLNESLPYDLLVDNGKEILRIQVKSTSQTFTMLNGKPSYNVFKFQTQKTAKKVFYKKHEVDFFAFYLIVYNIFYIIPCSEVKTKTINIYINNKNHKLHKYRENWLLLK